MIGGSTSTKWFFVYLNPGRIGIWKFWFLRRGENRSAWRKTSLEQRRKPTTNSTQIWHRCRNLNLGHILVGGDGSHHFTIPCSSSLASSFCCTCTIYEILLIYLLWFNFVLGLNFIFFCFKLINTLHYHT